MNNGQTRASLFSLAAAYLFYLCYGLFRDRHDAATSMPPLMRWLFIGLFAAAGVCLGIYAWICWRRAMEEVTLPDAETAAETETPDGSEDPPV